MRLAHRCRYVISLFALQAALHGQFGGTGLDGPFAPATSTTLDTAANNGEFHFTDVVIPEGIEVTLVGPNAAKIFATGNTHVGGELRVMPGTCMYEALAVLPLLRDAFAAPTLALGAC